MRSKVTKYLLSAICAATMLAGCGGSTASTASAATTKSDNILKMGSSGWSGIMNPIMSDNVYDNYVCDLVFEKLVTNNSKGEYVPELATWELSDDKLTYTFTLKDGIKFSDGTALTTADVAFTYNTIKDPSYNGPRTYVATAISSINVIDDKKIAFTMTAASPANIQNFTYGILSKDYYAYKTWDEFVAKNNSPMGSGSLKFNSWAAKQFVKLDKNENYWDSANAVKIDGILINYVEDDAVLAALQKGEIDFCMPAAKNENVEAIKSMSNVHLDSYLGNGYTFMCFNTTRDTLSDVRVRQALMYALDRESFIKAEYGSTELASVGYAPISPTSWAYPDAKDMNAYSFDLDKAASLLDDAGWKLNSSTGVREKDGKPLELTWLVYTDSTWPGTLSGMAFDTWGKIGVKLDIQQMDFDTVSARTMDPAPADKDFDIYTMGFSLSIDPDPTGGLFDADAYTAGGFNASGFRDDESQELMKEGIQEFDQTKRAEIYKKWAIRQNELLPTAIIAYRSEIWGISNRVSGLDLDTYVDFTQIIQNVTLQ